MSLLAKIKGKGPNGFGYGSTAEQVTQGRDLSGQTILITGSNSGLGLETARVLGKRGAFVIAAARTVAKAQAVLGDGVQGKAVACELSEPNSVRACVAEVIALDRPLNAIICNAGIMALPKLQQQYGYEAQFFTNHIGHFILVTGLLGQLADDGRVVMLSSAAHKGAPAEGIQFDNLSGEREYSGFKAYGQSKLANILFTKELAKRLVKKQVANAVHPGVIATNLSRHMNPLAVASFALLKPLVLKTVEQGAATQAYVATHPDAAEVSGKYFADCNITSTTAAGQDEQMAQRLWQVSEQIVSEVGASDEG